MRLNELFVSHAQVDPVNIDTPEPRKIQPLYINFDRARSVTSPKDDEEIPEESTTEEPTVDMSSWKVGTTETSSKKAETASESAESEPIKGEP